MTRQAWKNEMHYHSPFPTIAVVGFSIAVASAAAALLSGLGSRWGWWYFRTGFLILAGAAVLGIIAVATDTLSAIAIRGPAAKHVLAVALAGVIIGLAASGVPAYWIRTAYRIPAIHDITTDTTDPPQFVAILPLRANAINPATYGGPAVAAAQHAAYPGVQPLILPLSPAQAFPRALAEAKKMGWTIVAADPKQGRIEATATTFWFGFKDDIVIRLRKDGFGTRVDMRSLSRVGRGDLGTNARRTLRYLRALGMKP
jgi:uncharacterized protein (DUF1499 family)